MKTLINIICSLIIATWVGAIAVFSIQNIQPISLKFLTLQSFELPLGVLLAFSAGFGMILGAIAPALLVVKSKR